MMHRPTSVLAAAFLLLLAPPLPAQLLDHPFSLRSPHVRVLERNAEGMTLEFNLDDPEAYLARHPNLETMGFVEGPREGFLLAVPPTGLPHPQLLEVAYLSVGEGTPEAGLFLGEELTGATAHTAALRRVVVQRELGWVRHHRLALYQIRPYQRAYEGQSFRHHLYHRVRFRLEWGTALAAPPTEPFASPEWTRLLSALVHNPLDLPALATQPPVKQQTPRELPERYLKLLTDGEGLFEVPGVRLLELSLDARAEDLALTAAGQPLPFLLLDEKQERKREGRLSEGDRLLFLRGGSRSPFSRFECALLSLAGGGAWASDLQTGAGRSAADFVAEERRFEEDHEFASETEMGERQEHFWFWKSAAPSPGPGAQPASLEIELTIPGLLPGGMEARLELWAPTLQDLAQRRNLILEWEGLSTQGDPDYTTTQGAFPRLLLTQRLSAPTPAPATAVLRILASTGPEFYLDRVRLSYRRALNAESSHVLYSGPPQATWLEWADLPEAGAWLLALDATGELSAGRLEPMQPQVRVPADCRLALATGPAQPCSAVALRARPRLPLPGARLDALVVSHADFLDTLAPWAEFRRSQGRALAVQDVEDFYDLFGDGSQSPEAIRRGLEHLLLSTSLSGVILCGDASWDTWGRFPEPVPNWVPTFHLTPDYPSDSYYTCLAGGDPLPDLLLSRLPVQTATDLAAALEKIMEYPAAPTGEWAGRFLMLADNSFEPYVERLLLGTLPDHYLARILRFVDYPLTDNFYYPEEVLRLPEFRIEGGKTSPECTRATIREMDRGNLMVMYYGHGGGNVMGHERYFFGGDSPHSDVLKLRENIPAFYQIYSCWTGWFDFARPKWNIGLGEELLRTPGRGAVGLFLSTGRGLPIHHESLATHLHRLLFDDGLRQVGLAALGAQVLAYAETNSREPVEMFTLFGDYLLELPLPESRLSASLSPGAAPATAERRLRVEGLPDGATECEVLAVDGQGDVLFDGRLRVSHASSPVLDAALPLAATATPGPLRVAVAWGAWFGGTRGEITGETPHADRPLITDGSPDLVLESGSVAMLTPDPMEGETIIFEVTVENRGDASATNIQLEAYDGKVGDPELRLTNQVMLPPAVIARLDPGERTTRRIRWDPWDNAGPRTIFFVVDPRFQIDERSKRNNVASLPIHVRQKADLVLAGRITRATDTDEYILHVLVQNQGESVARVEEGELLVLLRFMGAEGMLQAIQLASLTPLQPGETRALPPARIPRYASGRGGEGEVVAVEVEVDPIGIVNEITHKNNRILIQLSQLEEGD